MCLPHPYVRVHVQIHYVLQCFFEVLDLNLGSRNISIPQLQLSFFPQIFVFFSFFLLFSMFFWCFGLAALVSLGFLVFSKLLLCGISRCGIMWVCAHRTLNGEVHFICHKYVHLSLNLGIRLDS